MNQQHFLLLPEIMLFSGTISGLGLLVSNTVHAIFVKQQLNPLCLPLVVNRDWTTFIIKNK